MSITDFLVICSGADRTALAQRPHYERRRAAAIGTSVLLTGFFACGSAAYVGYLAFRAPASGAAVGLAWGALIFTVDRLLVVGVQRPSTRRLSPIERVREKRLAFVTTIPRLVLAAVIALPIAIPLQLRFFERELDMELARRRAAAIAQARFEVERMYPDLRILEAKNAELEWRVREKEKQVDVLHNAMLQESSRDVTVRDDRRHAYVRGRVELEELRRSVEQQIDANNKRLSLIRRVVDQRQSDVSLSITTGSPSFLARLDALNSLKEHNRTAAQLSTLLLALFIAIQIAPVLLQLVAGSRPNAELWEAVAVMAALRQSHISPEHPIAARDTVASPPSREHVGVMPTGSNALRVFMCHCSEDKPVVRTLTRQLHDARVAPWLDEERLLPGERWEDEIKIAVRNSDAVIICLSRRAVRKRGFVQKEIRFALDVAAEQPEGSIFLIPAKLEECDVPQQLQQYQFVRMHEHSGYPDLLKSLTKRATELERAAPG